MVAPCNMWSLHSPLSEVSQCILCSKCDKDFRGWLVLGQVAGNVLLHFEGGVIHYAAIFQGNMVFSPVLPPPSIIYSAPQYRS